MDFLLIIYLTTCTYNHILNDVPVSFVVVRPPLIAHLSPHVAIFNLMNSYSGSKFKHSNSLLFIKYQII